MRDRETFLPKFELHPRCLFRARSATHTRFGPPLDDLDVDGIIFAGDSANAQKTTSESHRRFARFVAAHRPTTAACYLQLASLSAPNADEELALALDLHPDALVVPAPTSSTEYENWEAALWSFERRRGRRIPVLLEVGSETGAQTLKRILQSSRNVFLLTVAPSTELDDGSARDVSTFAKVLTLGVQHRIPLLDGASRHVTIASAQKMRSETEVGRTKGARGRIAEHPHHVEIINEAYRNYLPRLSSPEQNLRIGESRNPFRSMKQVFSQSA